MKRSDNDTWDLATSKRCPCTFWPGSPTVTTRCCAGRSSEYGRDFSSWMPWSTTRARRLSGPRCADNESITPQRRAHNVPWMAAKSTVFTAC
jgi:hypothetical protein